MILYICACVSCALVNSCVCVCVCVRVCVCECMYICELKYKPEMSVCTCVAEVYRFEQGPIIFSWGVRT